MPEVFCALCGKPLKRSPSKIEAAERFFCNKVEADTYRGEHPEIYIPKQKHKTRFVSALKIGDTIYA